MVWEKGKKKIIADVYNKISSSFSKIKFFLAPRHLSRVKEVREIFKDKCIKCSLFSEGDFSSKFILVDVFGKL